MGICIVFTRAESATINSGLIRVQYGDKVGQVPTYAGNLPYEPVDTFQDKTEADLVNEYPRCDDYDEAQKTRSTAV